MVIFFLYLVPIGHIEMTHQTILIVVRGRTGVANFFINFLKELGFNLADPRLCVHQLKPGESMATGYCKVLDHN